MRTARDAEGLGDVMRCDLTDQGQVEEAVSAARPRWVFQCGGATQSDDPHVLYRVHVEGAFHVLSAVAKYVPDAVVMLFGSAAEYGSPPPEALPVREDYPGVPLSFFGASKLAQTEVARVAAAERGLRVLVVRPFNVLGPGLPPHYFAGALAVRLLEARAAGAAGDIPVTNADVTRDLVDVRDVVEALLGLAARAAPPPGSLAVYNVASGRETPLLAVAERLCGLAGGYRPVHAGTAGSRSAVARSCGDASKLREVTGWVPRISWERSVDDLWQAFAGQAAVGPSGFRLRPARTGQ